MISIRETIASVPPYLQQLPLHLDGIAEWVHLERPISLRGLADRMNSLAPSVTFQQSVVTGAALGGHVEVTLRRDGSYTFGGSMRATGIPSFHFRVAALIRSSSKQIIVALQRTGTVFGTDTPGDREVDWSEDGISLPVRNLWPDMSGGLMDVTHSSELSGVLGTAEDIVKDVAEFVLVAETAGSAISICLIMGSELGNLGVDVPGLGGVVGLGIVAGSLFIWGPLAIGPAILLGVAAGAVIDALVKIRRLTVEERAFANQVFGDSIDYDRIRLTNLLGLGSRQFTVPTVDNTILINMGDGPAFDDPINAVGSSYPAPGQIFIHELTHAWQIEHSTVENGYVPGYLCRGLSAQSEGHAAYHYGDGNVAWTSLGVEAQASIVDQWFGGNGQQSPKHGSEPLPMNLNSPYFHYISDNVQAGNP